MLIFISIRFSTECEIAVRCVRLCCVLRCGRPEAEVRGALHYSPYLCRLVGDRHHSALV